MAQIAMAVGKTSPFIPVQSPPILAQRAPTTSDINYPIGQQWFDQSADDFYQYAGGGTWQVGGNEIATNTVAGIFKIDTDDTLSSADDDHVPTTEAIKDYVDALVIAGAPVATEVTAGIGQLATDAEAVAGTPSTPILALFLTPSNLTPIFASPPTIGGTAAAGGTFTDLTADGTGAVSLTGNAASTLTNTAGDLTLDSQAGSLVLDSGEATADAVRIVASNGAGGLDVDAGTGGITVDSGDAISVDAAAASNFSTSAGDITIDAAAASLILSANENVADCISIIADNGGIDIICSSASAGQDIDVTTDSSINLTANEGVANALRFNASAGGVDADCAGQFNITSSQNAADAVSINASAGGIEIIAVGAAAEDLILQNTNGSVNVVAGEADAAAVSIQAAAGGLDADFALSCDIVSSQGAATAISLNASAANGGVTIAAGTGGLLFGNQADCTTIDVGDIAPTASRTTTIGGGTVVTASVTDLVDIAPDGATTNADSIKQVDINTGTVATGQVLTNVASGTVTSGTHTTNIATGNAAAGTMTMNLMTGTGTKTFSLGNADGLTTSNLLGPLNVNVNQNNNTAINTGTSTGTIDIGNTLAGAVTLNSGSTIAIGDGTAGAVTVDTGAGISLDAATASNFACAAGDLTIDATSGSLILLANEDVADAVVIQADNGGIDILAPSASAGQDIDMVNTGGSVNISATEADAAAVVVNASAGGLQLLAGGGAGLDTLITNTGGSLTITAGESAADAFNLTASGAAGAINLSAGTGGVTCDTGRVENVTPVSDGTTAVGGDDYIIATDTSGGVATLTLPASPATGRIVIVCDASGDAGAQAVTVDGNGNNIALAGSLAATQDVDSNYGNMYLIFTGSIWNAFDLP